MRRPCKTKHCPNLAVVGGAYCLSCRHRRRRQRASRGVCRDWSLYALPDSLPSSPALSIENYNTSFDDDILFKDSDTTVTVTESDP